MDASTTVPDKAATANKPKVPVVRLSYHGKAGQIFRLHLLNLFLNAITLGIYSFWGKTRIRKYMTSQLAVQGDRFEYTGTGKELMIGAIKALVIFIPLVICLSIPIIKIPAFFVFMGVLSLALYLSLRYRLSRIKWRGIRFHLGGSIKEFFILSLKRSLINIFTLGYKVPKSDIMIWSYIANNMSYGDLKFSYEGDAKRLQKIHLITMGIFLACIIVPIALGGLSAGRELIQSAQKKQEMQANTMPAEQMPVPTDGTVDAAGNVPVPSQAEYKPQYPKSEMSEGFVTAIMAFYTALALGFISRFWYGAALWHEKFRGLRLGGLRFKSDVTGKGLAKLFVTNIILLVVTLGLAKPIIAQRTLRYYVTNMRLGGDLEALVVQQNKDKLKSGMGDALAADVGFDLGM
jgi:uncharacterized membrane protein YjgN (DUF898 family)